MSQRLYLEGIAPFLPKGFMEENPITLKHLFVVILAVLLGLISRYSWSHTSRQRLIPTIPVIGGNSKESIRTNRAKFLHNSKQILLDGYREHGAGFFYVPSPYGERLMIPTQFLEELKTAPVDKVDFVGTFIEMFEGKYTTMGSRSTLHPRVVKAQLNQHLGDVMPTIQDEIRDAFEESFPACDDWTEVPVVETITQIVARVSGCMFGGPILSRNKEWTAASIAFAVDGFIGAQKLKRYPSFLRPIVARFIPEIKAIANHYRAAEKAAYPILQERERTGERADDLLYWMNEQAQGGEKEHTFLASILLKVSFAAIHTSAAAPSQLIFDLCEHPEYVEPLHEEYSKVMGADGKIDKQGFYHMPKMDSIMKESQRFNPLLLVTFERVITEDWKLSNGYVIPSHTMIGVPTHAITMDPTFYPDPDRFDGFRFAKIRESDPAVEGKAQYVASNPSSMAFGYGRHACPGRFFASQEIKAIMVYLLEHFDMKFRKGQGRPESQQFETQYLPDHSATVLFKKRKHAHL
ncbi:hypothetical protein M426DRAFT_195432 [Hypoxylon sp. CI-4A]|nr:hypothetical protein M426DRAFT_195432 [Hypoxylon sp. CI-4A]